ncbi:MAG TPA: glutamine--tRNA ligase, partial [Burkholderiales bacterium]|nr:glutamine--tRNA ligase [Burkholderiales bacterium]
RTPNPGAADDFVAELNPNARTVIVAQLEPALRDAAPETRFQFERHGYFVADMKDMAPERPVFNRTVTLRDSWGKGAA